MIRVNKDALMQAANTAGICEKKDAGMEIYLVHARVDSQDRKRRREVCSEVPNTARGGLVR